MVHRLLDRVAGGGVLELGDHAQSGVLVALEADRGLVVGLNREESA